MIDIQATLGAVEPEQSILLTFTLGLTQLDHAVLPLLQSHGDGRVTVVADQGGLEAAFAEGATAYGPGVRYRLLPYRPPSGKPFHPKVYLVAGRDRARLVVSSANLTLYGFRENLEIVEVAEVGPTDHSDGHLFRQALDFMDRLSDLEPAMGQFLAEDVEAMRERLSPLLLNAGTDVRSALLHSLDFSLIDQLSDLIPADEVDHILCVSPFFDGGGFFLRALCNRFPRARLEVIGPGRNWNDLNGQALSQLGDRIETFQLSRVDGTERRLHAKLFAFFGEQRSWTVAGSANATTAAWLKVASEPSGGNVEVVVVREHAKQANTTELRGQLECLPVALNDLDFDSSAFSEPSPSTRGLVVIQAVEAPDGKLRATIRLGSSAAPINNTTFGVRVEGRLTSVEAEAEVLGADNGVITLSSNADLRAFDNDNRPLVLWIEAIALDGGVASARTWLERPKLLNLTSRERRIQSVLSRARLSGTIGEEEVESITDALSEFLSRLLATSEDLESTTKPPDGRGTEPGGHGRVDSDGPGEEEDPNPAPFTLSASEMVLHRSGSSGGHTLDMLREIGEVLRRQIESPPTDEEEPREGGNIGPQARKGMTVTAQNRQYIRPSVHAAVHSKVVSRFLDGLDSHSSKMPLREAVGIADAIGWLLVRLSGIGGPPDAEEPGDSGEETVIQSGEYLIDLLKALFSIDGAARGTPEGRFIDSWLTNAGAIDEVVTPGEAEDFLLMCALASLITPRRAGELGPVAGGFRLVLATAKDGATSETLEERLDQRARNIATGFGEAVSADRMLSVIHEAYESTSPVRDIAGWWEPVFYLADGGSNPEARELAQSLVQKRAPELLSIMSRLQERGAHPIVVADLAERGKVCGNCREGIAISALQKLWDPKRPYLQCQVCGFIIAPFDPSSQVASRLLGALRHAEAEV